MNTEFLMFDIGLFTGFFTLVTLGQQLGWVNLARARLVVDLCVIGGCVTFASYIGTNGVIALIGGFAVMMEFLVWGNYITQKIRGRA